MFIAALFLSTQNWKQPLYPSGGEWINKLGHPNNGTRLSNKKELISVLGGWFSWLEHCPVHEKIVGSIPAQ